MREPSAGGEARLCSPLEWQRAVPHSLGARKNGNVLFVCLNWRTTYFPACLRLKTNMFCRKNGKLVALLIWNAICGSNISDRLCAEQQIA
ncbi:hypothetical protein FHS21_005690 [Phyllobacterium trifolii]|uniref:Uncharacterized protein n=1 Tax=Phyllobacterium trifolii TaxID=300193 RepID=A0A839UDS9_9HYPH|nr:hypothetical protein [Phyllobacterium trifolii]